MKSNSKICGVALVTLAFILGVLGCSKSGTPNTANPATPGQNGNITDPTQAVVTWKAAAGEQQGFDIEESQDGVTFAQVATVVDGVDQATISGLSAGHTYYFRVRGYNQAGFSSYSTVASVMR